MRLLPVAALALTLVPMGTGQPATPAGLVTVHAIVETSAGAPVPGLTAGDFEIVADGAPQALESVSAEAPPLTLVVLADVTASVADTLRSTGGQSANLDLKPRLATLAAAMKPGDRIRLGRIGAKVSLGSFLPADAKARTRAIDLVVNVSDQERGGPSPVWDAIDAAVTSLASEPGRRGVLVVTDGLATGNRLSFADAATRAAIANVSVSAIGFEAPVTIRQNRTTVITVVPEVFLRGIADYTGGLYRAAVAVTPTDVAPDPFATILPALGQVYTLGFRGAADGKPHPIEVRVKRPDLTVHARKAYVAKPADR